jgi:Icc-related predicted phosphoesterase
MKLCYAADLHGHPSHYAELLALVKSEDADALLLGGDLLPRKGHHHSSLEMQQIFVRNEFRVFAEKIREEASAFLCAILGNDDWAGTVPLFRELESEGLVKMLDGNYTALDDRTALYGYSFVPPTPFLLKDFEKRDLRNDASPDGLRRIYVTKDGRVQEEDEKAFFSYRSSIEEDLAAWNPPKGCIRSVCIMHGPPFGTMLDRLYDGQSAGSRAVRRFIQNEQPLITLHGHIHESPSVSGSFVEKIDGTLSVNPGQTGERLSAVLFDSEAPAETIRHTFHKAS